MTTLAAHNLLEDMRDADVASLRVVEGDTGASFYVSHTNDIDGDVVEEEPDEWEDRLRDVTMDFSEMDRLFERDDVNDQVKGWRIDAVAYNSGEPIDRIDGMTRQEAEARRDQLLDAAQPKGPRETLAEAWRAQGKSEEAIAEARSVLDDLDGLDSYPNSWTDTIDDEFPDDIDRRRAMRDITASLEDDHDLDPDSLEDSAAFEHALDLVRRGNTDAASIADRAVAYAKGVSELEYEGAPDRSREKQALNYYYDQIDEEFPGPENAELRRQGYELGINYATENAGRGDGSMFNSASRSLINELRASRG
ncbi:hypothetical protein [Nesterenkonia rhizosphaerae]|uniref:Uncharacterized protein n=1 Tax=Nesterenkonia rhizosphaerae TaxID=1348272 RepID=A0ABP9G4C5_9MICC